MKKFKNLFFCAAVASLTFSSPAFAKEWCYGIWKAAAPGNFALAGGSLSSADWRLIGPYSTIDAAKAERSRYSGYVGVGPTLCNKVQNFRGWISAGERKWNVSGSEMEKWNKWYNCTFWKDCR